MAAAGSITVGNYLIVRVAADNSGGGGAARSVTVSDPRSNSWTTETQANRDPGAAEAGTTCSIAWCKVTNAFTNGDDITVTYSGNVTADAVVVEEWSGIHATSPIAVAETTTTGGSTSLGGISRTPGAAGQLLYCAGSIEGPNGDSYTEDSDTTDGSWVSLTATGTSNGTADLNQKTVGAYKLVTGTTPQTWTATITSSDWAAVAIVFDVAPAAVDKSDTESGTVTEARTLTVAIGPSDSGTLADALGALTAAAAGSDAGTLAESFVLAVVPASGSDAFVFTESGTPLALIAIPPDAILTQTGFTGAVGSIDEDPDAADGSWVTSTGPNTVLRVSFGSPPGDLSTGAGLQEFRILVRP
jgi:hypothetical protein